MITFCHTQLHWMLPYLFISFLLVSCVVVHHQAVVRVSVCSSVEGVHGFGVMAQTGLLDYCTVKGPVLLCLQGHTTQINEVINTFSHPLWELLITQTLIPVSWRSLQPCRSVFWCSPGSPWGLTWRSPWSPLLVWAGFQPWSDRTCTYWPCRRHNRTSPGVST